MDEAQQKFKKYISTKQVFSLRLRAIDDNGLKPVHVSTKEIEKDFFPFPKYDRKKEIQSLVDAGELEIIQGETKGFLYNVPNITAIDLSLLKPKPLPDDNVIKQMLSNIKTVSLHPGGATTPYFDLFLKYKDTRPEIFFTKDDFCGRIHTPVTNFHRTHRPYILINNEETTSLDVITMQPLLLSKIIFNAIGKNEYTNWINAGEDIYIMLQIKADLSTRDEAKKKFFEILFSKPSRSLAALFGDAAWIDWINKFKSVYEPRNPKPKFNDDKTPSYHNNLAWLLQSTEVKIMYRVWKELVKHQILFLSVHDEIIIPVSRAAKAEEIMHEVLSKEFNYYKLNTKAKRSETQQVPSNLLEQHTRYKEAETAGLLANHPDLQHIRTLWKAVSMYTPKPAIQSLYLDGLAQINLT